jgi:hypothetical protein
MRPLLVKTLAVMLVTGLVLAMTGCTLFAVAVRADIAPDFDKRIMLDARHHPSDSQRPAANLHSPAHPPAVRLLLAWFGALPPYVLGGLSHTGRGSVTDLVPAAAALSFRERLGCIP